MHFGDPDLCVIFSVDARKDVAIAMFDRELSRQEQTFGQGDFTVQGGCSANVCSHKKSDCSATEAGLESWVGVGVGARGWCVWVRLPLTLTDNATVFCKGSISGLINLTLHDQGWY